MRGRGSFHSNGEPRRGADHYIGKPRVVKESSGSRVKLEQAAESVAAANGLALGRQNRRREDDKIALTLVVPFAMIVLDVFVQRPA